ncbi:MAG TPA: TAXI family TRAP transporter solute-binding subunit [Burkholderiales bacterium]|nr:TAXI family TRAP transporter solute-binding subunit [Burkholderiales bacterium]
MEKPDSRVKTAVYRLPLRIARISWRDLAVAFGPMAFIAALGIWAAFHFIQPAPPGTLIITSGPDGSSFRRYADRYQAILARHGVKLAVLASAGAAENLRRLADPAFKVDIGFVQGGLDFGENTAGLVSLGSVAYQPLLVFYRGAKTIERLSQLAGKRVAIGAVGSGTHALALALLKANGMTESGSTRLLDLGGEQAVDAMLAREADAAFLMGDSASGANMRKLILAPGVRLFDFTQIDGYVRRFRFLSKLELPRGSMDLAHDFPAKRIALVAPTVELIARPELHPALSDLLIEAAREVHGRAGLMQGAREFPAPLERDIPISDDAARFYKSGKSFVYRHMPFWLASLVDRTVLVLIPIIVLLIPGLRVIPMIYGWRIRSRIFRRYGELMTLEREMLQPLTAEQRAELRARLAAIERAVIGARIPGSHADELYVLRQHIKFVSERLKDDAGEQVPK